MTAFEIPDSIDHLTEDMTRLEPSDHPGGLLVVLPHPDDESFAAGGTISLFRDAGLPATYLCGTWGDGGRRMGNPPITNRESMRDIREAELAEACAVLGCDVRLLGFRDKTVEFEDPEVVADAIAVVIAELSPDVVITFYPGHGVHPDHDALGAATCIAVERMVAGRGGEAAPLLLGVAVGERDQLRAALGPPHVYADIRAVGVRKYEALRAHRSQTQAMFQHFEKPDRTEHDVREREFRTQSFAIERFYVLPPD